MKTIRKGILFLIPLFTVFFTSCKDELPLPGTQENELNGEIPVVFDIFLPETSTRGFSSNADVKRIFKEGDLIHILGTFEIKYNNENDEPVEETITRYGALSFDGRQWNAATGSKLTWPSVAVSGQFIAYYISESNGILTSSGSTEEFLLSDLTPSSDPLYAESDSGIPYGYAVEMNFNHICTYLTLVNMEPLVADYYWFISNGVKEADMSTPTTFNNAFKISLGTGTNEQPTLNFEFTQSQDLQYDKTPVYISGKMETETDPEGNPIGNPFVSYFLEPAYYETFDIIYPATTSTTYTYLQYDYKNVPDNIDGGPDNNVPNLMAGTTYTLDITKAPGVAIEVVPSASGWDDYGPYYDVDVEEFLKSACTGGEYYYHDNNTDTDILILEKTVTGSLLLHNVNFDNFPYENFETEGFYPNIGAGLIFDGGQHYIRNLHDPLFRYNYGTIKNIGIKDANLDIISYEGNDTDPDMSRNGSLLQFNQTSGEVQNVRVYDVTMNVEIESATGVNEDEVHNIGGVVGSNLGSIEQVGLSGDFTINVTRYSETLTDIFNVSVLIGGITGQNAASGKLYDISPLDNTYSLSITNTCSGSLGSYSIGGISGENTGYITGVVLSNVSIDSTGSSGTNSYIGGMVGQSQPTVDGSIISCNVSGQVAAGSCQKSGALNSGCYTGGMVGAVLNTSVTGCRAMVSVTGSNSENTDVVYATGETFGRIRNSSGYNFMNLISYGNSLEGPENYRGTFCGVAPNDQTWYSWYETYETQNILVKAFDGIGLVGANLNSNETFLAE